MTAFLQSLGSRVAKAMTKPFSIPDGDKATWSEIATKEFDANAKAHKLLYYTRYIGSTHIERIQVDIGSVLSIIPKRLLYFLIIPLSRLSTMNMTIYGFNAGSSHPTGQIRLQCQIGDLK